MPPGMDINNISFFLNPYDVCEQKNSGKRASLAVFGLNRLIYSKWPPNYQICEKRIYWP